MGHGRNPDHGELADPYNSDLRRDEGPDLRILVWSTEGIRKIARCPDAGEVDVDLKFLKTFISIGLPV